MGFSCAEVRRPTPVPHLCGTAPPPHSRRRCSEGSARSACPPSSPPRTKTPQPPPRQVGYSEEPQPDFRAQSGEVMRQDNDLEGKSVDDLPIQPGRGDTVKLSG
ncbi:uncharacterized protein VTP21DRAFT_3645 [Calcarisporiella thermophila]|uniref:uncharacterized protein n=1 Tax=Calcarisporiella thermophila TaxID=911321 RepID=UPI003743146F